MSVKNRIEKGVKTYTPFMSEKRKIGKIKIENCHFNTKPLILWSKTDIHGIYPYAFFHFSHL